MERLAEQIVDWHNRHPFARRIRPGDVHTIGVVALPFVRASAEAGGLVEPVLTDAVTFDELAAAPRPSLWAALAQRLRPLLQWVGRKPRAQWRAFSERFLPGLSPARVEQFALAHGFSDPPATPETKPWRVIVIDEQLASARSGWPFELYLMTAGIDAGSQRTRVLAGRGIPSEIIGRRLWDPRRVGAAAAVVLALAAAATWALWPRRAAEPVPAAPAPAASAAAASAVPAPPARAEPPASAASAEASALPASAAELPASTASAAAPGASGPDPDAPPPDIRPRLVERPDGQPRPPLRSSKPQGEAAAAKDGKAAEKPVEKPVEEARAKAGEKSGEAPASAAPAPADPRLARMAQSPNAVIVALVGPPGTKAEAQAHLQKMQAGLVGVHGNPSALQADVIQTPEGWRAAVWPFPSREQAQLINATLVARGLKTKAVNF